MRLHAKKKKLGSDWVTYVEVGEQELDPCTVNFDSSPPEPDVGFGGDLEIESVIYQGVDLLGKMSKAEEDNLLERLNDHLNAYYEDWD